MVRICPLLQEMQETWIRSLGQEDTLKKEVGSTPVFWLGESHGQSSLAGYSPWGRKESDTAEQLTLISIKFPFSKNDLTVKTFFFFSKSKSPVEF